MDGKREKIFQFDQVLPPDAGNEEVCTCSETNLAVTTIVFITSNSMVKPAKLIQSALEIMSVLDF